MITDQENNNQIMEIAKELISQGLEGIGPILQALYNEVMKIERSQAIQADPYERSANRKGYANGFKEKVLNSRSGQLKLQIPQVRGMSFYPNSLEKGTRSEKALKLAIAEMYIKGVSTRKVQAITEKLCGLEISSTTVSQMTKVLDEEFTLFRNRLLGAFTYIYMDAHYVKIRHGGTVISMAVLVAIGVNKEGRREILGISTSLSEAEVHWRGFLKSLVTRGLHGIKLIISDDHMGLKKARESVFPSIPWQRCQFHMSQNAQKYAPKKEYKQDIAESMRDIFQSPTKEMALIMKTQAINKYLEKAPAFSRWLDENIEEGLTCYNFPRQHQKKIRTTNPIERINREIKRRVRVAVLFPNEASALRLVTGVLSEIHDDWITERKYLDMELTNNNVEQKEFLKCI